VSVLIVTAFAPGIKSRATLVEYLTEAGFLESELRFMSVAPSDFPFGATLNRTDIKESRAFLDSMLAESATITHVLAMGNEALSAVMGHSGIMKWRGKMEPHPHVPSLACMATISPGAVARNPSQRLNLMADLKYFFNAMVGIESEGEHPEGDAYRVVATKADLAALLAELNVASVVAFDLETNGFDEMAPDAFIVSIALTTAVVPPDAGGRASQDLSGARVTCWTVPLCHRASVWRSRWELVLNRITAVMRVVPVRVAHNAKFDCRWLVQFGGGVPSNFDTMLAAHVLNENRVKGLKPLARILLGAGEWDIQIKQGKNSEPWYHQHPLKDILWYNGLDTWHTFRLFRLFRADLDSQPRTAAIFDKLMMPASQSLVHIERRGVWVDREALEVGAERVASELDRIDNDLLSFVPDEIPYSVNFNASNFLKWFLYEHLELPILERTKTGGPSTAEGVLSKLVDHHPVIPLLLERVKWNKFQSSFFNPYRELLSDTDRLHTTFKLAGTVTGRLSSGKADTDKVTGARPTRGVNLQQVPRDPLVRSLFGVPPGWTFVEADYSQAELRVAAEVAKEPTMLMLYATGQDIHMVMAMRMTGKPQSQVTKEERKAAKAVNFGFLYGMGAAKFIETAWNNYGVKVTEAEALAFRHAFFQEFGELQRWHQRQRKLVRQFKRVESPMGRVRHLPDVDSPDKGVQGEAERQAINSPVQAMASDLCLLSMVVLDRKFRKLGLQSVPIGTVHDAINFEVHTPELDVVIPLIKQTMEHPPLERLFGISLSVPLVADIKLATRWGVGKELEFADDGTWK
jgi:DNA polymerase I-like protein with 3'-5' exonuclease and polymerase domains